MSLTVKWDLAHRLWGALLTMGRKPDPIALGRRLIRGHMYGILVAAKLFSLLPYCMAAGEYLLLAAPCFQQVGATPCRTTALFPAIWCMASGYMAYLGLDGLIVRWVVTYSQIAAIVRMVACVLCNYLLIQSLARLGASDTQALQIWVFITCILTVFYILQSFIASSMTTGTKDRTLNLFHTAVYAVIPIGMASFFTMIGLIRTVMNLQHQLGRS